MVYDTLYAHQDKYTDKLLRVGSTALRFGDAHTKIWLSGFTVALLANLAVVGIISEQPWPFYAGALGMGSHLFYQLYSARLDDPRDCLCQFRRNPVAGLIFFAGIAAANTWRWWREKETKPSRVSAAATVS
jgi:4-hydroxybenzoate polyprenyltransferase